MTHILLPVGASAAAMLIFILPSAFYIKLVKKESMKSMQKIGVRTNFTHLKDDWLAIEKKEKKCEL